MAGLRMKLHVGCGSIYKGGYVNVDAFDGSVADCLADALLLPFPDHSSERIESYQLIEHLGFFGAFYHLAECHRVLAPDGTLVIETPDPVASFEKFLKCENRKDRGETLNWIFGHSVDGYAHRFLFPEDALRELLARSGFTDLAFEQARTHVYAPGLRVVSVKNGERIFSVLAHLRRSLISRGFDRPPDPVELVEFEQCFVANALGLLKKRATDDGKAPTDALVEMIVLSPRLTLEFVDAVAAHDVPLSTDVRKFRPALEWLVSAGLTPTMFSAFEHLSETPNYVTDGYDHVVEQGKAIAGELLEGRRLPEAASLADLFDLPAGVREARRDHALFSRAHVTAVARRWRDRGIKHFCRDELDEAEVLLTRSINSKVEYFYSVWNMAILRARSGALEDAIEYYKLAQRFEVPGTADALGTELEVLQRHVDGGASFGLPPIRCEPVLVGDYVYARP